MTHKYVIESFRGVCDLMAMHRVPRQSLFAVMGPHCLKRVIDESGMPPGYILRLGLDGVRVSVNTVDIPGVRHGYDPPRIFDGFVITTDPPRAHWVAGYLAEWVPEVDSFYVRQIPYSVGFQIAIEMEIGSYRMGKCGLHYVEDLTCNSLHTPCILDHTVNPAKEYETYRSRHDLNVTVDPFPKGKTE